MAKDSEGHFGPPDLDSLHKKFFKKNTTEGGACLTGHEGNFKNFNKKSTCNYRYQAYEQADSHGDIKKCLHSYEDSLSGWKRRKKPNPTEIQTSAYDTKSGGKNPAYYCATLPFPENGDWHIGGPSRDITRKTFKGTTTKIPKGKNFSSDTWPYWNNAHHLIPKGTLKLAIMKESSDVSTLIQRALMSAQYNINHKKNMLLMPQDREVAEILNLPRHIQLKDDDEPDLDAMCTNHPVYNEMVVVMRNGLESIIAGYVEICNQAIEEAQPHEIPDPELDKTKLEKLSEKLLKIILGWSGGSSLDALAKRENNKKRKHGGS